MDRGGPPPGNREPFQLTAAAVEATTEEASSGREMMRGKGSMNIVESYAAVVVMESWVLPRH